MPLPVGPHRRFDPLTRSWVLVSAGRTQRPWQGRKERGADETRPAYDPACYLCPGNARANGERNPDYSDTFAFTNDYAALQPEAPLESHHDGLLVAESEPGTCRVLCFSPRHDLTLADMPPADVRSVIDLWAAQTDELGERYRWVQVFENRGQAMGASNPHPHGQIWAGTSLPGRGEREDAAQRSHHSSTGTSLLLDIVAQESASERVVEIDDDWLALVPFWAVWPFETILIPRRPAGRISDLDDGQRSSLARTMQRLMARYDGLFDRPLPYSMGWHQAPFDGDTVDHWQLHAHFLPPLLDGDKRKFMVGYELLSEPQRDITAEDAAERLRAVQLPAAPVPKAPEPVAATAVMPGADG